MNNYKLIIGSHVSLTAPNFLLGAVEEAKSYAANTYMFYTGAPQNTVRKDVSLFKKNEAYELMNKLNINKEDVIVHAPYIINLCSAKPDTRQLAKDFLITELKRVHYLGFNKLVLHPGSRLDQPYETGLKQVIDGINFALKEVDNDVMILIETMAGKGSEIGRNINEIADIIKGVEQQDKIGVCVDTCHISDAGYDLDNFDEYLNDFDRLIGLEKIKCLHINDSMNPVGAHKDRHQNIGYGHIGFDKLLNVIYHPKLDGIPKILETPYIECGKRYFAPYKQEIQMIREKKFEDWIKNFSHNLSL